MWAREALRHVTVAVGNRDEVEVAVGTRDPLEASAALLGLGRRDRDRQAGARRRARARPRTASSRCRRCGLDVVNGLGAGDAFGGALVHALLRGLGRRAGGAPGQRGGRVRRVPARVRGRDADDRAARRRSWGWPHEAHRRPGAGPLPRRAGGRARRQARALLRRLLRDLRARQRRRARPGAAAARRPAALLPGPQRAGDGPHRRRLRAPAQPARRRAPARRRSARARRTWSPARRSRRSTGCRCCCCPGDTFATRAPHPVLQQLEVPHDGDLSVNDCLRPVSRYFDRDRAARAAAVGARSRRCAC